MGQAQRSEQRRAQYRDVELELWELDKEDEHRVRTRKVNYTDNTNRARRANYEGNPNRTRRTDYTGSSRPAKTANRAEDARYTKRVNDTNGGRRKNDNLNIMVYEQRQGRSSRQARRPERELQIQDIRKYQRTDTVRRAEADNASYRRARSAQAAKRRQARKIKAYLARTVAMLFVALCVVVICCLISGIFNSVREIRKKGSVIVHDGAQSMSEKIVDNNEEGSGPPVMREDYLPINEFSRPGTPLTEVNNIFVHYTANPGTSAAQNRSYFANLALTQERSASAHLIIGYDGEIIQCIPFDEQAYAVMTRNEDSISIECCYKSGDGSFTQETYDSLIHTLAWLIDQYDLSPQDILRHYDCGGKKCPIYYVEHEDAWEQLLRDVENYQ